MKIGDVKFSRFAKLLIEHRKIKNTSIFVKIQKLKNFNIRLRIAAYY